MTAAGQVTATTATALPLALIVERPWRLPPSRLARSDALVGLALLSTAVAYVIYVRLLAAAGAANLLLVTFLIPVSALLPGIAVLGGRLEPCHFAGIGPVIGLGLAAMDGRPLRALKGRFRLRAGAAPLPGGGGEA